MSRLPRTAKPAAKVSPSDLPQLIENIENRGGDASELRKIMDQMPPSGPRRLQKEDIDDDQLVELVRADSKVEEGENLVCSICQKPSKRLTSGACDDCFYQWALSCKEGYLRARRQHGSSNNG